MSNPAPNSTADSQANTTMAALRALGDLPPKRSLLKNDLTLTLSPREDNLAAKDVPVDTLAKKVIGVRDKLRVLEQRVNSSKLTNAEKVNLEHHVTALYSALSSMMAFFSDDAFGPDEAAAEAANDAGSPQ